MIYTIIAIILIILIYRRKMATATSIPMTERYFYTPSQKTAIASKIAQINKNFGSLIEKTATDSNVPAWLITAMIFIESAGNPNADNGSYIGLGQLGFQGLQDTIIAENNAKKINSAERKAIEKGIGITRTKTLLGYKYQGQKYVINKADLFSPEFNIAGMGIFLSRLIDQCTVAGVVRYDQIVIGYNTGQNAKIRKQILNLPTDQIIQIANKESANYVTKLVGRNGIAEIILKA
jgi:hypothetical protein